MGLNIKYMNYFKKLLFSLGAVSVFIFLSCKSKKSNQLNSSINYQHDTTKYQKEDTVSPFKKFDFTDGSWKAIIRISPDDRTDISPQVPKSITFTADNIKILDEIKLWKFRYLESDIATVSSSIDFFKNNVKVASYGIVLDKNSVGLQSQTYGWIEAIDSNFIFETIKLFKY